MISSDVHVEAGQNITKLLLHLPNKQLLQAPHLSPSPTIFSFGRHPPPPPPPPPLDMAVNKKISAASARTHTRKSNQGGLFPSGIFGMILVVFFMGFIAWICQAIQPPPPKVCGSANGRPPVTAPRIKLSNGRYLAYKEQGVPKDKSNYKIIFIHAADSCRHGTPIISQELMEELGIYLLSFDRPGYGESDPNPKKTGKNIASDIEELADQLDLGSKFYVIGYSMGGQIGWMCLKYIPHRLAGVALLAPVINFWWRGIPANISNEAYKAQLAGEQWALRVAHYAPWLFYWWNNKKWLPSSNVAAANPEILSFEDKKLVFKLAGMKEYQEYQAQIRQQGEFESIHRDMIVGFGRWEFSPIDLENPFPANEGSVHLWQGDEDLLVPVTLQRYIAEKLSWIRYHEVPGAGHLLILADGFPDTVVKALLLGH